MATNKRLPLMPALLRFAVQVKPEPTCCAGRRRPSRATLMLTTGGSRATLCGASPTPSSRYATSRSPILWPSAFGR